MQPEEQRKLAAELFNHTWSLMDKRDRSARETELMVHAAHASRFLWEEVGEPVHHARGEWQVSRAHAVADRPGPALHHAQLCLAICEQHGIGDFDIAFAHEALARAHRLAGDTEQAAAHERLARRAVDNIADKEDRDAVLADLDTLPRS